MELACDFGFTFVMGLDGDAIGSHKVLNPSLIHFRMPSYFQGTGRSGKAYQANFS